MLLSHGCALVLVSLASLSCKSSGGEENGGATSSSSSSESTSGETVGGETVGSGTIGSGTTDATPTSTGGPDVDPREDHAEKICTAVLACECTVPPFADMGTCVAEIVGEFEEAEAKAAENGLVYDETCAAKVAAAYPTADCKYPEPSVTCDLCQVVSGQRQVGDECTWYVYGSDCAPNLVCLNSTCYAPCGQTGEGQPCVPASTINMCAEGLHCPNETQTCVKLPGEGEPCPYFECADGFTCGAGVCTTPLGEGENCEAVCCGDGLYCSHEEGGEVCKPRIAGGKACSPELPSSCVERCVDGFDCDGEPFMCREDNSLPWL